MRIKLINSSLVFDQLRVAPEVTSYVNRISGSISQEKIDALSDFFKEMRYRNLLECLSECLPMFGNNADDCKIALIGNDIQDLPSGATYDKGLNLLNAEGGIGPSWKGVLLFDGFSSNTPKGMTMFACTSKSLSGRTPLIEYSDVAPSSVHTVDTSFEMWQGFANNKHRYPYDTDVVVSQPYRPHIMAYSNSVKEQGSDSTYKAYEDGVKVKEEHVTSGKLTQSLWKYFYAGRKKSVAAADGGVNMIMIFNKALSDEEVQLVSSAIKRLQDVIFA